MPSVAGRVLRERESLHALKLLEGLQVSMPSVAGRVLREGHQGEKKWISTPVSMPSVAGRVLRERA